MQESDIVKDFLFEHIKNSEQEIQPLISSSQFSKIIDKVLCECFDKVITLGDPQESSGVFATGLLHYILTNALVSSQRKVECQGIELDIVIPDLKMLQKDPKKAIIICIPKTLEISKINKKLSELNQIQPESENIWLVLTQDLGFPNKTFVVGKNLIFSKIILDIINFINIQNHGKFKILRI